MIKKNIYNSKLKNCVYLDYGLYSMKVLYTWVNMSNWLHSYTTVNCQKLWTAYLFRRSYETFPEFFVASFMPEALYFHVFRWIRGEPLTFCEIKFGHKKYPYPLNPNVLA